MSRGLGDVYKRQIQDYRPVWSAEVFARSPRNWEKSILRMFSKLLTGLWLNDAPSAYSFCNLDLRPIKAYSQWNHVGWFFRSPACIEVVEGSEIHRGSELRVYKPGEEMTKKE